MPVDYNQEAQHWVATLDDYEIEGDTPDQSRTRVANILGREGTEKLYEGITDTIANPVKLQRTQFINTIPEVLEFTPTCPVSDPTLRKTNPEKFTISLEKLLGAEGVKLYQQAIEEEHRSTAFRDAVFLQSTKNYFGKKWSKKLCLWVGGPSASGKTFAADNVVKRVSEEYGAIPKENFDDNNYVVSADGSVEREVSQIRQLVLQIALAKGYSGISDLQNKTENQVTKKKNIIIKDKVFEAVKASQNNVSMVIADTFTGKIPNIKLPSFKNPMDEFAQMDNVVQVFSKVKSGDTPEEKERLRRTVKRLGNQRAWSNRYPYTTKISINNRDINCDSKDYDPGFLNMNFHGGKKASSWGRDAYISAQKKHNNSTFTLSINNDTTFVRKLNNEWIECETNYTGPYIQLSYREFREWKKYNAKRIGKPAKDLTVWLQENINIYNSVQLNFQIDGINVPDKPKKIEHPKPKKIDLNDFAGNAPPHWHLELFTPVPVTGHEEVAIEKEAVKTAAHFLGHPRRTPLYAFSNAHSIGPALSPPGVYHIIVSKVNFPTQFPAVHAAEPFASLTIDDTEDASKLKPDEIRLNFVKGAAQGQHGCYVERIVNNQYEMSVHRLTPEIDPATIVINTLVKISNESDQHRLFRRPHLMADLKEIAAALCRTNAIADFSVLSAEQQAILKRLGGKKNNLQACKQMLDTAYHNSREEIISAADGSGDYSIPSKAYLEFVEKQCQSFYSRQGQDAVIRILPRDNEDPLLIKAYVLVCAAHDGWGCKDRSQYSETMENRAGIKRLLHPEVLDAVRAQLNISPAAPVNSPVVPPSP
jgi:hypothetical protein